MWAKLDYRKKNILLIAAMVLVLYIAYLFSFKNTFAAMSLNRTLKTEQNSGTPFDSSFQQTNREDKFYASVVKGYNVVKEDYENHLWQAVSGMAVANNVTIAFSPTPTIASDTLAMQKKLVSRQFSFKGNYFNLVKLLDTLSKSPCIGKISSLKLMEQADQQDNKEANKLILQLRLSGIMKY